MAHVLPWLVLAAASACALLIAGRWAFDRPAIFSVVLDDSAYYAVIAHRAALGQGFTFSGLAPTNGFEPLWQLIAVGLALFAHTAVGLLQLLSFVASCCWVAACWVTFGALRKLAGDVAALLASVMLMLSLPLLHVAATGMEFGVDTLGLSLFLLVLVRCEEGLRQAKARPLWLLGATVAACAMARTEQGPILAGCVAVGLLVWVPRRLWLRLWPAAVVPAAVEGAYLTWNALAFHTLIPISGMVKLFYETEFKRPTIWQALQAEAKTFAGHDAFLATHAAQAAVWTLWAHATSVAPYALVALALLVAGLVLSGRYGAPRAGIWGASVFVGASAVHAVTMAAELPNFLSYGTWYFGMEYMAAAIIAACVIAPIARVRLAYPLYGATGALVVLGAIWTSGPAVVLPTQPTMFQTGARWIATNLPAGIRVGAYSSGTLAAMLPQDTVVDLDGLVNDVSYLQNFLLHPNRGPAYFRSVGIQVLADEFSTASLKDGSGWPLRIPISDLQVLRYWKVGGGNVYAVFAVKGAALASGLKPL